MPPVIVTTWKFGLAAAHTGWELLSQGARALDAIEKAANVTELDPDVTSVGYGGLPNREGVVELDAAIMDGATHAAGAVAALTGIKTPISVARLVMERTPHTMLAGDNAKRFALANGFTEEDLLTPQSRARWEAYRRAQNVSGPDVAHFDDLPETHDTIGLCALDRYGDLAAGCTTSGLAWKWPGRVGDSPIIGSGLYADNAVGAAAATGHGDEMMRACISFRAVTLMEQGLAPQQACVEALRYLIRRRPPEQCGQYGAALIALRRDGVFGAAATRSGFHAPNRLWQWAVASEQGIQLHEGVYVTLDTVLPALAS